jgi:hypothetical protein
MFGIMGTLLLVVWLFDYALAFTPRFVQSPLFVLACLFLVIDFIRGQVVRGKVAHVKTPSPVVK